VPDKEKDLLYNQATGKPTIPTTLISSLLPPSRTEERGASVAPPELVLLVAELRELESPVVRSPGTLPDDGATSR